MKKKVVLAANNKKAYFDYFVLETFEAGIVLTGTEIKSIRQGKVSIKETYAKIRSSEVFVLGMHISPYEQGNIFNVEPLRERKLLLHKREISKIEKELKEKGKSLIPLKLYINSEGRAKMEIGLCQGKKNYDKRESIAQRDAKRKMDKVIKNSIGNRR
ncbi:MAG: SsrA-binding protein SmpB [Eubacteriales bacterium]|nr:SsrA-binding protein SmpB [Eubacteriales bacterium]MDY3333257.1 SsrA-binding protein SmpB [Gallibacter sp.]